MNAPELHPELDPELASLVPDLTAAATCSAATTWTTRTSTSSAPSSASAVSRWNTGSAQSTRTPPRSAGAAPARAENLAGLPPTSVCVGGADGFRDEDIDFAQRLMAAGVDTELHVYPGVPHGVRQWADTEPARRSRADQHDWLARQFARLAQTD